MVNSTRYSFLALRIGLAIVFLWFGIDKFFHPDYWLGTWMPEWILNVVGVVGISASQLIYVVGIFEILIALSMVTSVFMRIFSLLGMIILLIVFVSSGFENVLVRDLGLVCALLAVVLWPEKGSDAL